LAQRKSIVKRKNVTIIHGLGSSLGFDPDRMIKQSITKIKQLKHSGWLSKSQDNFSPIRMLQTMALKLNFIFNDFNMIALCAF